MKTIILLFLLAIMHQANSQPMETIEKISWYGQAAIKIENDGQLIYIDPYQLPETEKADVILITHSHGDHLSIEDIKKIITPLTQIICPHNCADALNGLSVLEIIKVSPGDIVAVNETEISAVPMYNVVKTNYHPAENLWTGFIVNVGGVKIYHAGDTERIPEMKDIDCDIVLLPLGQTYTMNSVEEAAEAAMDTGAEIAIPIHYGMYEGTKEDALKFKQLLEGKVEVIILEPIRP